MKRFSWNNLPVELITFESKFQVIFESIANNLVIAQLFSCLGTHSKS